MSTKRESEGQRSFMFSPFPADDLAHMIVNILLPALLPPPLPWLEDGEKQNTLTADKVDSTPDGLHMRATM